jgi:hypothetical protein
MSFSMVGKNEIIAFVKIVMFANCLNMRKINKYSKFLTIGQFLLEPKPIGSFKNDNHQTTWIYTWY